MTGVTREVPSLSFTQLRRSPWTKKARKKDYPPFVAAAGEARARRLGALRDPPSKCLGHENPYALGAFRRRRSSAAKKRSTPVSGGEARRRKIFFAGETKKGLSSLSRVTPVMGGGEDP